MSKIRIRWIMRRAEYPTRYCFDPEEVKREFRDWLSSTPFPPYSDFNRTPCMISTKSDLILRDYDLFADLARTTYLGIAVTITCMDEDVRKLIEPNVISSRDRFKILKEFSKIDAVTGMHFMPVIPFITEIRALRGLFEKN